MASYAGIFDLPLDMFNDLMSDLDYESILAFRQTSRLAAALVPLNHIIQLRQSIRASLLAEERADYQRRQVAYANQRRWATAFPQSVQAGLQPQAHGAANTAAPNSSVNNIHRNRIMRAERLNCYACLKHLPRECFVEGQVTGRRSLGHNDAGRRFCKVCGVNKGIWDKGTVIQDGRCTLVLCRTCNALDRVEAGSKREGVCSTCKSAAQEDSLKNELQGVGESSTSQPTTKQPASTQPSSRATRCLRCWATNHTEVPAGSTGSRLCPSCEAAVGLAKMAL
ncbi:uncharacterized protein Z520_06149 [Fonsecaea multimorphosa CBS 102226]|uniref:F-box domain-containing protein n=1 Tax=Fonsecaea multimorphosa CBS 102226 TaxID=1442371 RepID=A0A0D2K4H0_9EURO|nr:uncharacterized protein Z520_06149 [Fonsecaea multimorphosa CBS 102226]KIX98069.1 hypothetical protein Z520_06149 [Fonsecaea multimorphosa CBS 102226]OAL24153.1 hypothetical protein AYO22_05812 [Fonsecaea multimorphosa]